MIVAAIDRTDPFWVDVKYGIVHCFSRVDGYEHILLREHPKSVSGCCWQILTIFAKRKSRTNLEKCYKNWKAINRIFERLAFLGGEHLMNHHLY